MVRFTITERMAKNESFKKLCKDILSIDLIGIYKARTVVCSDADFARFLITRNERGLSNDFKSLNPAYAPGEILEPYEVNKQMTTEKKAECNQMLEQIKSNLREQQ